VIYDHDVTDTTSTIEESENNERIRGNESKKTRQGRVYY
jgi:hypothetical protein